jgi:hypothetical protein
MPEKMSTDATVAAVRCFDAARLTRIPVPPCSLIGLALIQDVVEQAVMTHSIKAVL